MSKLNIGLIGYGLIGKTLERGLIRDGHALYIFDREELKVNNFFQADITNENSLASAIQKMESKNVKLDAVVNCSYPRNKTYGATLEEIKLESFNENLGLHLGGYFNVLKQFGFYFKKCGGGTVISFSSIYGVVAPRFDIYEGQAITMPVEYAAIKSSLIHLNKYFATYFKGTDVRFNLISPGGVYDNHNETFVKNYGKYSLSKRGGMLDPEDLIGTLNFLVSNESRYINGQNLIVDDGWTLS